MGIHNFQRAEHLRVPERARRPDEPSPNDRTFDSDPRRSIPMAFGYRAGSVRFVQTRVGSVSSPDVFDVYAKAGIEPIDGTPDRPDFFIGTMTTKTISQTYAEMDRRGR